MLVSVLLCAKMENVVVGMANGEVAQIMGNGRRCVGRIMFSHISFKC